MTVRFLWFMVALAGCVSFTSVGRAESRFNFSGFGTLGYSATDTEGVEYYTDDAVDGADDSGTYKIDTRLGLQFDATIDESTTGTLQLQSRQTYDGDFHPRVAWAFIKNQINDSLVFRIGRMSVPFFMVSDFRHVGYANIPLRPAENTYVQAPLGSLDGLDLTGYYELGDTEITAQAFVGFRDKDGSEGVKIRLRDGFGANIAFERGITRLRFSAVRTRLGLSTTDGSGATLEGILNQASSLVPELSSVAEEWNGRLKPSTFLGIGLEVDLDPFVLAGEFTHRDLEKTFLPSFNAWYLTAAYRWRNFTPYVTFSQLIQTSKTEIAFPTGTLAEPLREPLNQLYASDGQTSFILGLRWDFMDGAALKFQAENIARDNIGANFTQPADAPKGDGADVNLFSLTVDFMF